MSATSGDSTVDAVLARSKHRCPAWCHRCPDLVAIVKIVGGDYHDEANIVMPGDCWNGCAGPTSMDSCNCYHATRPAEKRREREREIDQLERLINAYPSDARTILSSMTTTAQRDRQNQ